MNIKTKKGASSWVTLCAMVALIVASPVQAASFDCAKAQSKVERLICSNEKLSKIDEQLADIYATALKSKKSNRTTFQAQKQWIKERNGCVDSICIEMAYRSRKGEILGAESQEQIITVYAKDENLCEAYANYVIREIIASKNDTHLNYRRTVSLGNFGSLTWSDSPPQCKRPFVDESPEFMAASWKEVSPEEYPELAVGAYRIVSSASLQGYFSKLHQANDEDFVRSLREIKERKELGGFRMWLADVDINNNGVPETLLKVEVDRCGYDPRTSIGSSQAPRWKIPIMVVDSSKKIIDAKTDQILNVSKVPTSMSRGGVQLYSFELESFDAFQHSGVTYFDRWEDEWVYNYRGDYSEKAHEETSAALTVYAISNGDRHPICRLKISK